VWKYEELFSKFVRAKGFRLSEKNLELLESMLKLPWKIKSMNAFSGDRHIQFPLFGDSF
jgi:hypothetical protein